MRRIVEFRKNEEGLARMTAAARRLQSLTALLAHLRERLGVDIGFVLWDGTTVPGDLAPDALALAIADEGAVAALIRRPKLDTLFNLLVTARLELRNGTLFDLMTLRPRVRSKNFRKALDKTLALATAARFLLVPRGGPWPLEQVTANRPAVTAARRPTRKTSSITTTCPTRSTR